EVETVRRSLESLVGLVIRPRVHRADVVRGRLREGRLLDLHRLGKQLAIVTEAQAFCVQLGMSGQMLVGPVSEAEDHVHVRWQVEDGRTLRFRDPRRFGGISVHATMEDLRRARWSSLGPDALGVRAPVLEARLRGRRALKAALLDQQVLAGVGNIYADEALFRARLDPHREASALEPEEVRRLASSIRAVLRASIGAGGSTLRDHRSADGRPGAYQSRHRVYGRGGHPCPSCGRALEVVRIAQRTTTFCPACQR
ncbi:MAG: bifunctional DNA-formamidopyrimidine glycosylase/DNA-(apurinic or apyrimidinic site) lyase, partial [Phycisphaerales bacterium]|nr:bifunctional DNA-formamidopyrimidine glycosylase/DNA-(apurinic or apyrimidinic site) lyase [Phycisphaerales bacterium]